MESNETKKFKAELKHETWSRIGREMAFTARERGLLWLREELKKYPDFKMFFDTQYAY